MAVSTSITLLLTAILLVAAYGYMRARGWIALPGIFAGLAVIWSAWGIAGGWDPFAGGSDPQVTLRESEWRCADSHEAEEESMIPAGSAIIPVTYKRKICDRYERR